MPKFPYIAPGDILLYSRSSWFNWAIRIKTWSQYTHVEIAGEAGSVYASRNVSGVGHYAFDPDGLALVLAPFPAAFNLKLARDWFYREHVYRQGYDYLGLLNFYYARWAGRENNRMFCSEFAARFLRQGGLDLFPGVDADTISPRDFTLAGLALRRIWSAEAA
jgi:hypothetical protein